MMMQGVSRNILPALSELRSKRDLAGFKRLYLRATIFTGLAISGLTLAGLLFVPFVLPRVLPDDYARPVFRCCLILTVGVIPLSFAVAQDPFYILTDRMKANVVICFIGALVTIPANMILIRLDPTTGPVWGLTVYMAWVLVHFVYIAHYFRRVAPGSEFWSPAAADSAPFPAA
jgi:O-antigen/teichoic acid export membrane protein